MAIWQHVPLRGLARRQQLVSQEGGRPLSGQAACRFGQAKMQLQLSLLINMHLTIAAFVARNDVSWALGAIELRKRALVLGSHKALHQVQEHGPPDLLRSLAESYHRSTRVRRMSGRVLDEHTAYPNKGAMWLWLKNPVPKMEPWQVETWT